MQGKVREVFDFCKRTDQDAWRSVDDVVMGGVSSSHLRVTSGGIGIFEGVLSLERGGGFASVRSRPERIDLSAYHGLEIRVRGDGKRYRLRLRTHPDREGVAYQVGFETQAGVWQSSRMPFKDFRPRFRGRDVPDAPRLDVSSITSFGWIVAGSQAGPFRLEIDWMRAYGEEVL